MPPKRNLDSWFTIVTLRDLRAHIMTANGGYHIYSYTNDNVQFRVENHICQNLISHGHTMLKPFFLRFSPAEPHMFDDLFHREKTIPFGPNRHLATTGQGLTPHPSCGKKSCDTWDFCALVDCQRDLPSGNSASLTVCELENQCESPFLIGKPMEITIYCR